MLGFDIGLRALLSSQRAIDVTGQNLANFATDGYSRQGVSFRTTSPIFLPGIGALGTGVTVTDVRRAHDGLLELRLRAQSQRLGRVQEEGTLLRSLEGFFLEPGEDGLSSLLDSLFGDLSALTGSAGDPALRGGLVQSGVNLTTAMRQLAGRVGQAGRDARDSVDDAVGAVNALLRELGEVNRAVLRHGSADATPPDLLDSQDRLVRELSEWLPVQAVRRDAGEVDLLVSGRLLVSGSRVSELEAVHTPDGDVALRRIGQQDEGLDIGEGRIAGRLRIAREVTPEYRARLDEVARALIQEFNRIHSTGIPADGFYRSLVAGVALHDVSSAASPSRLPLAELDLPFPPVAGRLVVNVVDEQTGSVERTEIAIDPATMSLDDLADALDAVDHLHASVDAAGRLRLGSAAGYGFDFSTRLDPDPDDAGTFGAGAATLTGASGPFALTSGDQLSIEVDGGAPQLVTFNAGDFADIANATADEVATAINSQIAGATASVVDGRIVVKSDANGTTSSLLVTDVAGSPAGALGLSTTFEVGSATPVDVRLEGTPEDGMEGRFTVRAAGNGTVGLTPGLEVEVVDENGRIVATVDVGEGYVPGEPIEVLPGVSLRLGVGDISADAGDSFSFDVVDDSDSAGVLVALELATFFTGSDAASIGVADRIVEDPRLVAGSSSGEEADGSNFLRLLGLRDDALEVLGGRSLGAAYGDVMARVGRDVQAAASAERAEDLVMTTLEARRQEISGVNLDQEILRLAELEQMHEAAVRYLAAVNEITDTLFNLL